MTQTVADRLAQDAKQILAALRRELDPRVHVDLERRVAAGGQLGRGLGDRLVERRVRRLREPLDRRAHFPQGAVGRLGQIAGDRLTLPRQGGGSRAR